MSSIVPLTHNDVRKNIEIVKDPISEKIIEVGEVCREFELTGQALIGDIDLAKCGFPDKSNIAVKALEGTASVSVSQVIGTIEWNVTTQSLVSGGEPLVLSYAEAERMDHLKIIATPSGESAKVVLCVRVIKEGPMR